MSPPQVLFTIACFTSVLPSLAPTPLVLRLLKHELAKQGGRTLASKSARVVKPESPDGGRGTLTAKVARAVAPRSSGPPKGKRYKNRVLKEIRQLRSSTNLLVSRRAFVRLLRELLPSGDDSCGVSFRFTSAAVYALQEACEAFLVHLLAEAYIASLHARRVTLKVQ